MPPHLILGSSSPRRRQLLAEAGYSFDVDPSDIPEPEPDEATDPAFYVSDLAWRKAAAVAGRCQTGLVLAADTAGAVDGLILNKPTDVFDAERMIRLQEGRDSEVFTGICLFSAERREWVGAVEVSTVRFRTLSDRERADFLESGRWRGKAGAYGVQDRDPFVEVVSGSFSNVVGLPMERLERLLRDHPGLAG